MTTWHALFLGIVQGITEFLPVSSSGHLALGQYFLGLENLKSYVLFDLVCHLGTLLAIVYSLRAGWFHSLTQPPIPSPCGNIEENSILKKRESRRVFTRSLCWQGLIATLPLFPLVFLLKPIKQAFDQPWLWGPCFLASACMLFVGFYFQLPVNADSSRKRWQDPLTIGVFQAIAILPGISRSGTTISIARLLGWSKEQATQFSFLLAIPAILGGTVWEGWHAWHTSTALPSSIDLWTFFVGLATSFLVGCLSLRLLIHVILKDMWVYFAWYCLTLGLTTTVYFYG